MQDTLWPEPKPQIPKADEVEKLCREEELEYNLSTIEGQSIYEILNEWFNNWMNRIFSKNITWDLMEVLLWSLLAFAVITIAIVLIKSKRTAIFFQGLRKKADAITLHDLEVSEDNWQRLVDEALRNEQYNLLIRLYFIRIIRHLNEQNEILFTPEKTNRMYRRELVGKPSFEPFSAAARLFDYHIYGGFRASKREYEQIKTLYNNITHTRQYASA